LYVNQFNILYYSFLFLSPYPILSSSLQCATIIHSLSFSSFFFFFCVHPQIHIKILIMLPQSVAIFGDRVVEGVIKIRWGC
jgi:hypothetical protein